MFGIQLEAVMVVGFIILMIIIVSMTFSRSIHLAVALAFGVICGIAALAEPALYSLTHSQKEYKEALAAKQAYFDDKKAEAAAKEKAKTEEFLKESGFDHSAMPVDTLLAPAKVSSKQRPHKLHEDAPLSQEAAHDDSEALAPALNSEKALSHEVTPASDERAAPLHVNLQSSGLSMPGEGTGQ